MADLSAARTPLAEKSRPTSKSMPKDTSPQSGINYAMRGSPNENSAPAHSAKAPCDKNATIAKLRRECEDLRRELRILQEDRDEEQQDILRARAALEEKEYQVGRCLQARKLATLPNLHDHGL